MLHRCGYLAGMTLLLLGCGAAAPPGTAARVGSRYISSQEVAAAVTRLFPQASDAKDPAFAKKALDALIASEILRREGLSRGLDREPEIARELEDVRRKLVAEAFYVRDVWSGVQVTDAEIRQRYMAWGQGVEYRLAHILCRDSVAAEAVLAELHAGQDFRTLAQMRSRHRISASRGGDLGYLPAGKVFPEVLEAVRHLPSGALVPYPVHTRMGYHVVQLLARRQRSLEEQYSALEQELRAQQRRELKQASWRRLEEKYALCWNAQLAALLAQRRELPPQQVLFRWRGGELTAAAYLRRSGLAQPAYGDTARIHTSAKRVVMEDLANAEGLARGYQQLQSVQQQLRTAQEELFAARLFDERMRFSGIDSSRVAAFYRAHRQQYVGPERITIREIFVRRRGLADSLYALVKAGTDMDELARRFTLRSSLREAGGLWRNVDPGDPRSAGLYRAAQAGAGLLAPIMVPGGFSVVDVLEKLPGEQLGPVQAGGLIRETLATQVMDAYLDSLRGRYAQEIEIY